MAKVKYDPAVEEINNKHYGFTFQRNHYGNSMQPASRSSRTRQWRQFDRMQNLEKAIRFWRDMAPATKTAWNTFAATYPQPTKKNPLNFLSGYQLFLKRNHYLFLNNGLDVPFMELPTMENLPYSVPTFEIKEGDNCLDMTELYIRSFGIIPMPGQFVLFIAVPMSETSGQFFTPITNLLTVEEVYIDGFFLNIVLPAGLRNITFSVYLSKPVSSGVAYAGTKVRFMGCFSSKTFLQLTDTPDSYSGQALKIVSVKADETGLEFTVPASGGLTCATLAACPTIISINNQILHIADILILNGSTSIPDLSYGMLYNAPAFLSALKISSSDDWYVPSKVELEAIVTAAGGAVVGGGPMKDTGLIHWLTPNTGATNSKKTFCRGAGRNSFTGAHNYLKQQHWIWTTTLSSTSHYFLALIYNAVTASCGSTTSPRSGCSIRLIKSAPGILDGTLYSYLGNNGQIYRAVALGGYYILADNLAETKFRDGSLIPFTTDIATWSATLTAQCCAPQYYSPNI